jgi:hypothetical protein
VKEDFQSIYNMHELLISVAVPLCLANFPLTFDFLLNDLSLEQETEPATLFGDFTPSADFLKNLCSSFVHYSKHDLADKSVNG